MTTGVTGADVGKRVSSGSGEFQGWLIAVSEQPGAYVVDDSGVEVRLPVSQVSVAGPSHEEAIAAALTARDARRQAPEAVQQFAEALYALPARLADTISLHPYAVADALVDLLDSGATS